MPASLSLYHDQIASPFDSRLAHLLLVVAALLVLLVDAADPEMRPDPRAACFPGGGRAALLRRPVRHRPDVGSDTEDTGDGDPAQRGATPGARLLTAHTPRWSSESTDKHRFFPLPCISPRSSLSLLVLVSHRHFAAAHPALLPSPPIHCPAITTNPSLLHYIRVTLHLTLYRHPSHNYLLSHLTHPSLSPPITRRPFRHNQPLL